MKKIHTPTLSTAFSISVLSITVLWLIGSPKRRDSGNGISTEVVL